MARIEAILDDQGVIATEIDDVDLVTALALVASLVVSISKNTGLAEDNLLSIIEKGIKDKGIEFKEEIKNGEQYGQA